MFDRAILFDLDGTLYTMGRLRLRVALTHWRSLDLMRRLSSARDSLRGQRFAHGDAYHRALYAELARRSGRSEAEAERWYQDRFFPSFIKHLQKHGRARPGLEGLLLRLRSRGVGLAVHSDYGAVSRRLTALGIRPELFDLLLSSEQIGQLKPSPAAIELLRRRWDLPRRAALMVGDRDDFDGGSARAAGVGFVHLSNKERGPVDRSGALGWDQACRIIEAFASGEAGTNDEPSSGEES